MLSSKPVFQARIEAISSRISINRLDFKYLILNNKLTRSDRMRQKPLASQEKDNPDVGQMRTPNNAQEHAPCCVKRTQLSRRPQ